MFLLSLPQSQARRAAIEPRIRMHASNLTLVQPYDGRRARLGAAEVAALACFMLLPEMPERQKALVIFLTGIAKAVGTQQLTGMGVQ